MSYREKFSIVAVPEAMELATSVHALMTALGVDVRDAVIPIEFRPFADGEVVTKITDTVRRTEVIFFFAAPYGQPEVGKSRLSSSLHAIRGGSSSAIHVALPYFFWARQDRKSEPRTAISVQEVAIILESYHVQSLYTFDLHSEQIMLAFRETRVDNLWGQRLLARYSKSIPGWTRENVGIVAPDAGSAKLAEKFAAKSGFPVIGTIFKDRKKANCGEAKRYIGDDPGGRHIILPDDMVDTAGTVLSAGTMLLGLGAQSINVYTTHWIGSPKEAASGDPLLFTAEAKFRAAGIRVVATNTIPRSPEYLLCNNDILQIVSCDEMLASVIKESLTPAGSVSQLSE